jgi:hypothetical protein
VINGDAALGQQLLDVPVGQSVPQVPAAVTEITSGGNRKPPNTEDKPEDATEPVSRPPLSANATVPSEGRAERGAPQLLETA